MYKRATFLLALILVANASKEIFSSNLCGFHHDSFKGPCKSQREWIKIRRASSTDMHSIVIAVSKPQDAEAACSNALDDVSDPRSPNYGKYYTLAELSSLNLFNKDSSEIIKKWLSAFDMKYEASFHGDFIRVTATVGELEDLLDAEFHVFQHFKIGKQILRTASYSVPKKLAKHVDFIGNTVSLPMGSIKQSLFSPAAPNGNVDPSFINSYLGITSNTVTASNATQALFEALGQSFSPSDLSTFQSQFGLTQQAVSKIIGPNDPSQCPANPNNCAEANLDVQYIMSVARGSTTTFWSIDPNSQDPFLDWIVALGNTANPPLVHSISYGSIATEDPQQDMFRFNTEVCQLGLRGLTVVVSSGDDGVANFEARNDPSQCGFNPSFPATSPYVTAVGATQGPEYGQAEIACSSSTNGLITTGGGFSIYFSRPSYQNAAVTNYLQNGPNLPPSSQFNSKGRGYPDVSILGHNYEVVIGGTTYQVSGTSASAPVFAGVVTLVNNARINAGKSPLGFLNNAIYQLGASSNSVFRDITVGENNCCAGNPPNIVCCQYGFNATTGWDPLTGFGVPRFNNFLKALLALP